MHFFKYNRTPLDMYNVLSQFLFYQTRRKNPLVYKGLNVCLFFVGNSVVHEARQSVL